MYATYVATVHAPDAHTYGFLKRQFVYVCLFAVLINSKLESHLTQDPLAQKNDGPTKKLHVSFLMADHPD